MPIPVQCEPGPASPPLERCCFCRQPTDWWTAITTRRSGEQVACCAACSEHYRVKDVPSKVHWCETEDKFRAAQQGYVWLPPGRRKATVDLVKKFGDGAPILRAHLAALKGADAAGSAPATLRQAQTRLGRARDCTYDLSRPMEHALVRGHTTAFGSLVTIEALVRRCLVVDGRGQLTAVGADVRVLLIAERGASLSLTCGRRIEKREIEEASKTVESWSP